MNYIAVYCASSRDLSPHYYELAREAGSLIARAGFGLVTGGGAMGMMQAAIDGCLAAGGEAVGVIPEFMDGRGWAHPGLTRKIVTRDMHERKATMARLSSGAMALPGGIGTMDELMEIMTWRQLDLYAHAVAVVNDGGFYDDLLNLFQVMHRGHFMRQSGALATFVPTVSDAVDLLTRQ